MLQAAVLRLTEMWPKASITVITPHPERLAFFCPTTKAITDRGHKCCATKGALLGRFWRVMPGLEDAFRTRYPLQIMPLAAARLRRYGADVRDTVDYLNAVSGADLVMLPGGGWIYDACEAQGRLVLDTIEIAQHLKKPTALMGQGLGPLHSSSFRKVVKRVLPKVGVMAVRERLAGVPLLRSVGVPMERIAVTGDDTVEMAYNERKQELGTGIGINLRLATYSEVSRSQIVGIHEGLRWAIRKWNAGFVPLPISFNQWESDVDSIKNLLEGIGIPSDGGGNLATPLEVIQQAGQCRLVITGSYHAAVFALSQGIPAIGLAASEVYREKFTGLADQFGDGCEVLCMDKGDLTTKLIGTMERFWTSAVALRPALLAAAERQIEIGRAAYHRIEQIVA